MALQVAFDNQSFSVGDTIRVYQKITEKGAKGEEKTRTQFFEGMLIAVNGKEGNKSFTVRRIGLAAVAIERIYPVFSPIIERVELVSRGSVRRAKLYYLRHKAVREVSEVGKRYSRKESARLSSKKKTQGKKTKRKLSVAKKKAEKPVKKIAKGK